MTRVANTRDVIPVARTYYFVCQSLRSLCFFFLRFFLLSLIHDLFIMWSTRKAPSLLCPHYLRYCCADSGLLLGNCFVVLSFCGMSSLQVADSRPCPGRGVLLLQWPLEEPLGAVRVPSGGPPIRQVCSGHQRDSHAAV